MATICRTSDGDLLDTICHQYYGHLNGSVEAVLDANQGLADEPQPYRVGVQILLPDLLTQTEEVIQLWG
ncbi:MULTISPECIES: tail protein X [Pseudomonas]|uniref:Tail protein X n=1 Tax=Pseudomonas amygdali pv. mori TaxID=34065 RepID=A0A3M5JJJ8_PSEA0|nr:MULTISPECIES: tail protein X [Pseudomonas]QVX14455.1 phage tail protein [Pseudomonas congelans]RMT23518.1 Tail protein X [Pseudomonas amygdali pv. mori]RMV84772.1 Tail protein X [Pseudomonas amygdali pv. sesami]RXT70561.1 phage tail protein [Pseudomonas syringae]RXT96257.1 phage tail protein [Pseudomonas syringae]